MWRRGGVDGLDSSWRFDAQLVLSFGLDGEMCKGNSGRSDIAIDVGKCHIAFPSVVPLEGM